MNNPPSARGLARELTTLAASLDAAARSPRPALRYAEGLAALLRFSALACAAPPDEAAAALADPAVAGLAPGLRAAVRTYTTRLERAFARELLSLPRPEARARLAAYPLYARNRPAWDREAALVRAHEPVLFVGSGPLPLSALHYALAHGLRVTCLDRDADALGVGRRVAERLGARLSFVAGDALDAEVRPYGAIVLASFVEPKARVAARLLRDARPDALVVARSASGLWALAYEPLGGPAAASFRRAPASAGALEALVAERQALIMRALPRCQS